MIADKDKNTIIRLADKYKIEFDIDNIDRIIVLWKEWTDETKNLALFVDPNICASLSLCSTGG